MRHIPCSGMSGHFSMLGEASGEDLSDPEEQYLNRSPPDRPGARSHATAPAPKSPDYTAREHRLVIAIDYGTTFTGQ